MDFSEGVIALRSLLNRHREHAALEAALERREDAIAEYGTLFDPENIGELTARDFGAFVRATVPVGVDAEIAMTEDIERLRRLVAVLVDETEPVGRRVDAVTSVIPVAVSSTILMHVDPERYSAWTSEAEASMMRLGLWTAPASAGSPGAAYATVNRRIGHLVSSIPTDRWTLDALLRTHLSLERTRRRPSAQPVRTGVGSTRRSTPRPTAATNRPAARPEFTCRVCFSTKDARLRSDRADVCVDCA